MAKLAHPLLAHYSPEAIVDRLQRVHERRPRRDRAGAESPDRKTAPPDVGFGKRANGSAGETAYPMLVGVRSQLVAGEPVDLVFLDAVEDDFVAERDAVVGTVDRALPADLAKVFDPDIDRLVRHQRQVGHDRIGHVDAGTERLVDDEPVSSQLADVGCHALVLWSHHAPERSVSLLLDVTLNLLEGLEAFHMV